MAFKEVQALDADITIALGGFNKKTRKENPTSVEGYYLGYKKVNSPKSKSGETFLHYFQTDKGNIGVWGKTDMDRKITGIKPGTMTRVIFDKMVTLPTGNEMYGYKVAIDEDNTIDVDFAAPSIEADSSGNHLDESDNLDIPSQVSAAATAAKARAAASKYKTA